MSTMNGTASGSELNVYSNIIKLSEINNEKELLKNVKDVHDGFDGYRECFPAELNFSDNKDTNISGRLQPARSDDWSNRSDKRWRSPGG